MERRYASRPSRSTDHLPNDNNRSRKRPRWKDDTNDLEQEEEHRPSKYLRPDSALESPSPPRTDATRAQIREAMERERRERMARIRAENESEEAAAQRDVSEQTKKEATLLGAERIIAVNFNDEEEGEEEDLMQRLFGVSSFGSSKNTKVATNHATAAVGVAQKHKARKYRQYMNRKNGFNRPLDNV